MAELTEENCLRLTVSRQYCRSVHMRAELRVALRIRGNELSGAREQMVS